MKITWKRITDAVFANLLQLIDEGRIKPGSEEERKFLSEQSQLGIFNLFRQHGIAHYPTVTVKWDPMAPDDLVLRLDSLTVSLLRAKGLL